MYIQANKISKNYSDVPLFENLSCTLNMQDKIGLIGQNGTGKTTFLQMLIGSQGVDEGTVSRKKGLSIGYIPQKMENGSIATFDYVYQSFKDIQELQTQLNYYEEKMCIATEDLDHIMKVYGDLQQRFETMGGYGLEDRITSVLKGLDLAEQIETPLGQLSGGERIRVELAKVLLQENDVLLLDEPTNHLDLDSVQWLEEYLRLTNCAFLVISHNRAFLDNVVKKIMEIEDGQIIEYSGNYSRYMTLKKQRIQELQKNHELQQKEIKRLKGMIRRYRQWGNEGDNEAFFKKAKEIERRLEKMILINAPKVPRKKLTTISQDDLSGKEVWVAKNIKKTVGKKYLFSDSSFKVYRGERIAILGKNGSGKSTLLKVVMGEIGVDEGAIKTGASLSIGYLPQHLTFDQPEQRILNYVKYLILDEQKARQVLANFGFFSGDVAKRIKDLSGGEQVRLYLLKLFQKKINVLILDEPTNHLDIYVREEVEELLSTFTGTILAVTHDRYFLRKNFDQILLVKDKKIEKLLYEDHSF